jgi:hypothetical protein
MTATDATETLLHQFEEALTNLQARVGARPTRLQQLEIDAVTAQADDLRDELAGHERVLQAERLLPNT